jgi:hypothetical protein
LKSVIFGLYEMKRQREVSDFVWDGVTVYCAFVTMLDHLISQKYHAAYGITKRMMWINQQFFVTIFPKFIRQETFATIVDEHGFAHLANGHWTERKPVIVEPTLVTRLLLLVKKEFLRDPTFLR